VGARSERGSLKSRGGSTLKRAGIALVLIAALAATTVAVHVSRIAVRVAAPIEAGGAGHAPGAGQPVRLHGLAYDPVERHVFVSDENRGAETVFDAGGNRIAAVQLGASSALPGKSSR
jgi:hypothetical protein